MLIESPESLKKIGIIIDVLGWSNEKAIVTEPMEAGLAKKPKTHANLVNDLFFENFTALAPPDSGIEVGNMQGQNHLLFEGIFLRLHMASSRDFRITINRTGQTREWNCSDRTLRRVAQPTLAGMVDPSDPDRRFWLAYIHEPETAMIPRVGVGLYINGKPQEIRELELDEGGLVAPIVPILPLGERSPVKLKPATMPALLEGTNDGWIQ